MPEQNDLSSGTTTFEVYHKEDESRPFSKVLAASGRIAVQATNKMRMLQDIGWPAARLQFKDDFGNPRIVKKNDPIWLLKCKPSCWRLYFYVLEKEKEKYLIIYVYAVCKKTDKEDPQDAVNAKRIADARGPIIPFTFPVG